MTYKAKWMMTRRSDGIALAIVYVTLFQLAVGVVWIRTAHAQSQETVNDRLANRQSTLEARIATVEQMNLPVRLAVLEQSALDAAETKKLIYGVFLSLVGILIAQIVQIRGQRKMRRADDEYP